jgi:hypothetical protein
MEIGINSVQPTTGPIAKEINHENIFLRGGERGTAQLIIAFDYKYH